MKILSILAVMAVCYNFYLNPTMVNLGIGIIVIAFTLAIVSSHK